MSVFHRLMDTDSKMRSTKLPWHGAAPVISTKAGTDGPSRGNTIESFPFQELPMEIQLLVLRHVPARTLTRSIAATSKQNKYLVDLLVQRKLVKEVQSRAPTRSNVVVFEAQRPIDTLTTRHVLHFDHFEHGAHTTAAGKRAGAATLYAAFSFVPIEDSDSNTTPQPTNVGPPVSHEQPLQNEQAVLIRAEDGTLQPGGPTYAQPTYPGVLLTDQHRLRQAHVSSSVPTSGTSTPRARARALSPERRRSLASTQRQTEAGPSEAHRAQADGGPASRGRPSMDDDEHDPNRLRGNGQGYEQSARVHGDARLQSTWSEPVSSSVAALNARTRSVSVASHASTSSSISAKDVHEQFRARCRAPMYRFQLDTLDSFETWILSLTVQQRRSALSDQEPMATDVGFQQRWEKRVAEGLDRVFRDWFCPLSTPQRESASLDDAAMRESYTFAAHQRMRSQAERAAHSYSDASSSMKSAYHKSDLAEYIESFPSPRTLEIDGEGCTMEMQPHANPDADMHPALASMSSHYYLSSSTPYTAAPSAARVEYTFHCKSVRINAARLLSTFEDIDVDANRARQAAQSAMQRGRLLGLTSGGSSWTPGSDVDGQVAIAPRRRGFMTGRDAAAAVVIFGAARD